MYSDENKRAPECRANDEFLRRMLGGELVGGERLGQPSDGLDLPEERYERGVDCRGNPTGAGNAGEEKGMFARRESCDCADCPTEIPAPALAMVYAPKQCWRNVLEPQTGLAHGSMFAELILPFEGCRKQNRMEGRYCR